MRERGVLADPAGTALGPSGLQRLAHVHARLHRVGVLPSGLGRDGARRCSARDRAPAGGGPRPLVTAAGPAGDRGRARDAVPSPAAGGTAQAAVSRLQPGPAGRRPPRSSCSRSRPSGPAAWHPSSTSSSEMTDRHPGTHDDAERPEDPATACLRAAGACPPGRSSWCSSSASSCGACCTRPSCGGRRRRSPTGSRRDVSLAVLDPLVWVAGPRRLASADRRRHAALPAATRTRRSGAAIDGVDPLPSVPAPARTTDGPSATRHRDPRADQRQEAARRRRRRLARGGHRLLRRARVQAVARRRASSRGASPPGSRAPTTSTGRRRCGPSSTAPSRPDDRDARRERQPSPGDAGGEVEPEIGTGSSRPPTRSGSSTSRRSRRRGAATSCGSGCRTSATRTLGFHERQNGDLRGGRRPAAERRLLRHVDHVRRAGRRLHAVLPRRQKVTQVREDDGVHFNADGYTLLMRMVAEFAARGVRPGPEDLRGMTGGSSVSSLTRYDADARHGEWPSPSSVLEPSSLYERSVREHVPEPLGRARAPARSRPRPQRPSPMPGEARRARLASSARGDERPSRSRDGCRAAATPRSRISGTSLADRPTADHSG